VNESAQERQRSLELFAQGRETEWRNRLIWGDKKYVLPSLLAEFAGKVNLIYIDPPFDTGADFSYTATIPDHPDTPEDETTAFTKEPSILEQKAYRDTWGRGLDSYLQWFYEAAVLLRELVCPDGTFYVHLGADIAHYVKPVCDEVFGERNFLNQIVWRFEGPQSPSPTRFATKYEVVLRYAKDISSVYAGELYHDVALEGDGGRYEKDNRGRYFYTTPKGDYSEESIGRLDRQGRVLRTVTGKIRIKHFLEIDSQGKPIRRKKLSDVWDDIPSLGLAAQSKENTGYPTQKPEALLERIIKASTREPLVSQSVSQSVSQCLPLT
jgi:DNA modification methylase